jgi:hypothetical protein
MSVVVFRPDRLNSERRVSFLGSMPAMGVGQPPLYDCANATTSF